MSKAKRPGGRPNLPAMGGTGNMGGLMNQVKKMQEEMEKAQVALADEKVEASAGGGMVSVVATGKQQIVSIVIQRDAVDPDDVEMLQDLVLAAVNEALDKSRALEQDRMGSVTGGLNLPPGLF